MSRLIPEHWKPRLRQYLREQHGEERDSLNAGDFKSGQSVQIRFPDRSFVMFHYAFAITDEAIGEIAVFTEHCGYHFFPLFGTEIKIQQVAYY